jgi:hypothetical protein
MDATKLKESKIIDKKTMLIKHIMSVPHTAVCQNLVPLVNIKIAGKWMFIPLKMVLIGIDPYPYIFIFHIQDHSTGRCWSAHKTLGAWVPDLWQSNKLQLKHIKTSHPTNSGRLIKNKFRNCRIYM